MRCFLLPNRGHTCTTSGSRLGVLAIIVDPAASTSPLHNTLICLPFSCSPFLFPHCCVPAFWIVVARFNSRALHTSALRYVPIGIVFHCSPSHEQVQLQLSTDYARYLHTPSHLTNCLHRRLNGALIPTPSRNEGSPPTHLGCRTVHDVSRIQGGGATCTARLGLGISSLDRQVRR